MHPPDNGPVTVSFCLVCFRLRRDNSGVFDYHDNWDQSSDGKGGLEDPFDGTRPFTRACSPPPQPLMFTDQPDLSSLIDTNFSEQVKVASPETRHRTVCSHQKDSGYDFSSLVEKVYEEQSTSNCVNVSSFSAPFSPRTGWTRSQSYGEEGDCVARRNSQGDEPCVGLGRTSPFPSWGGDFESSIWSLELQGNLIVAGRSNGRLEVRKASSVARARSPESVAFPHLANTSLTHWPSEMPCLRGFLEA